MSKKKNIVVLKCDACGKENRIREVNLYSEEIEAVKNNNGCFCSKCFSPPKNNQYSISIYAGESFHIYPKVINMEEYKQMLEGVERAKEILRIGLSRQPPCD